MHEINAIEGGIRQVKCIRKTIWIWTILLVLAGFSTEAVCADDDKVWLEQEISYGISDKLSYKLAFNERFYENITTWEEFYVDIGIDYKLTNWLVFGPRYRYIRANFNRGNETIENRWHLNVELIARFSKFTLESRTRYEYRDFHGLPTKHRLLERIKIVVPLPWDIEGKAIDAYYSDELNYDLDKDAATHHEMALGVKVPFSKNFSMKFYYGHEIKKREGNWGYHTNIIGITTSHKF